MLVVLQKRQAWQEEGRSAPPSTGWEELGRTEPRALPETPGSSISTSTLSFALALRVDAAATIQILVVNADAAPGAPPVDGTVSRALAEGRAPQLRAAGAVLADAEFLASELLGAATQRLELGFTPADALRNAVESGAVGDEAECVSRPRARCRVESAIGVGRRGRGGAKRPTPRAHAVLLASLFSSLWRPTPPGTTSPSGFRTYRPHRATRSAC